MKEQYRRKDLEVGMLVHAKLYSEDRFGYITSFSKIDPEESICFIDRAATFILDIDTIVTKEWYEGEKYSGLPFVNWSIEAKKKLKSMFETKPVEKVEKKWEGEAYPVGFAFTGD